jgi:hypothetical protein
MLSDPVSVTYNSVAKTLPRTAAPKAVAAVPGQSSYYNTSDGEFALKVEHFMKKDRNVVTHVTMRRRIPDTNGPFTGNDPLFDNAFGVIYETNPNRFESSVDIPRLRSSLLAFLDSTTESRILGGEL